MDEFLHKRIKMYFDMGGEVPEIPPSVLTNLPKQFKLRDYQEEALKYFIHNYETSVLEGKQLWNLFYMATGAGKTNLMAAIILYLYGKGYRNFIFFVNATNIVEKTKENFLNKEFKKYLFAQDIIIGRQKVKINPVESFANPEHCAINIMFTTIQGLHDRLNTPKENSISFNDFKDKKIVLLADEAHHFSASTKKQTKKEQDDENTWEDTIIKLFNINKKNILLEFTATCDLDNKYIAEKYKGNPADIVYDYPLLKFRESGYTKELMNLKTTLSPLDRTLQAMLLSQYRLKLFEKHGVANTKPVILLKAYKTVEDLDNFYNGFVDFINNSFNEMDINRIRNQAEDIVKTMFDYYENNGIDDRSLVNELKQAFSEEHIIKIHSKVSNVDELQVKLNDLENKDNPYRMVMVLDMLHEGWDVLNLFDIVRLADSRNQGRKKSSATTIQEAQLIGRGARYYPFTLNSEDNKFKRKFDKDVTNEMRVCETLYYHCIDNDKYISEIRSALKEIGFEFTDEEHTFKYKVKPSFKGTRVYKHGKLFINDQVRIEHKFIDRIPDSFIVESLVKLNQNSKISTLYTDEESEGNEGVSREDFIETTYKVSELAEYNINIVFKALRQFPVFNFNNLKEYFYKLKSHTEFVTSDDYAGRYTFTIRTNEDPTVLDIYEGLLDVFEQLSYMLDSMKVSYKGTKEFKEVKLSDYVVDTVRKKKLSKAALNNTEGEGVSQNSPNVNEKYRIDLSDKDWFVHQDNFGTTEEKQFVKYFSTKVDKLRNKYDEIYLIRNERNFHIYSFNEGRRFEPDYVLILSNCGKIIEQQQIFIEPKGELLLDADRWKEDFLLQLENEANCVCISSPDDDYRVYGLPFYNHKNNLSKFKSEFDRVTEID